MTKELDKHLIVLTKFQKWRKGDETIRMPDPKDIGESLDFAIDTLKKIQLLKRKK